MIKPEDLFAPREKRSSLDAPLEHLSACHRRIEDRLATMERAAEHFETQRDAAREAFAASFAFMESNGVLHTADEEESVFPRLRPALDRTGQHYLDELEREHAEAERLYRELKTAVAAGAGVPQAVAPLTALYRRHIASEEDVLQRYAQAHLTGAQLAAVAAEMKQRRGV